MYTKEYRKGYLAGIKRILNLIKVLDWDLTVFRSTDTPGVSYIEFRRLVQSITDLYDGLLKSDK